MEYRTAIDAFFAAKNDETNQTSKRKYFVPQATEGFNSCSNTLFSSLFKSENYLRT